MQALPTFTFANQAGLDMLETTLVALQDITLEKIFDDNGRKILCSEFPQIMQQVRVLWNTPKKLVFCFHQQKIHWEEECYLKKRGEEHKYLGESLLDVIIKIHRLCGTYNLPELKIFTYRLREWKKNFPLNSFFFYGYFSKILKNRTWILHFVWEQ